MTEQLLFADRTAFRNWLKQNHSRPTGLWLVFGKNPKIQTLTANEALEEALCFGWIDGLIKRVDEDRYIKFFSPRRTKSKWSERNIKIAEELVQSKRMELSGLRAFQRAKESGPSRASVITQDDILQFSKLFASNPKASANFQKMPASAQRIFTGYYLEAKQEGTRQRRLEKITSMIDQNKKPTI